MGLTHFSILNNHPEAEFVAVCDSSAFLLKNVRKYMSLETYSDYRKMIDKMQLDFVIVATPTVTHAEIVKYAIRHDLHVFVEKPLALSTQQGREIVELLKGKNLVNQVGYVVRFNEVFVQLKRIIESGLIGHPLSFKMELYAATVLRDSKKSWRSKKTEGGGCLYELASHGIDLINYIIGPPAKVVGSVLKSVHSANVEDAVYSTFLYENNLSGNLLVNWSDASYRKPAYRMEVFGRKGKMTADLHAYKLFLKEDPETGEFSKGWNIRHITDFAQPVRFYVRGNEFSRQLDYFIDCILSNTPGTMCSFTDGLVTDSVIESIVSDCRERGARRG